MKSPLHTTADKKLHFTLPKPPLAASQRPGMLYAMPQNIFKVFVQKGIGKIWMWPTLKMACRFD